MINLGKLYIPTTIDFTEKTKKITFQTPEFYTEDYINNLECTLQLNFSKSKVFLNYYCEDDMNLSDHLELSNSYIAMGDLEEEEFAKIQERALKVLSTYIDDSLRELLDLFND